MPSSRGILTNLGTELGFPPLDSTAEPTRKPSGVEQRDKQIRGHGVILVANNLSKFTRTFTDLLC